MTWTKLDDSFLGDPKFRKAGPHAELAFTRGLVYCNRYLTDGVIETAAVRELCQGFEREAARIASALVAAGLWQPLAEGGYQVTNFLRYQDSKAATMIKRAANAERQRRHRDKQVGPGEDVDGNGVSHGVSHALRAQHPSPAPPSPAQPGPFRSRLENRRKGSPEGPLAAAIDD